VNYFLPVLEKRCDKAIFAAMQYEIDLPRERLRRAEAAAYARRRLGQSVKVNTLRSWPIPYRQVGRDAVYELSDLDRFIDARLAAAPLRRAPLRERQETAMARTTESESDWAGVYNERRKSLASLGADEANFRSFDFVVAVCRERCGCDLETAKAMVRNAIAKAAAQ
jgi:hypothetical protein